jgi:hypothetical protein
MSENNDGPRKWRHEMNVFFRSGKSSGYWNYETEDMTPQQSFSDFYDWFMEDGANVFEMDMTNGVMIFVRSEIERVEFIVKAVDIDEHTPSFE